MTTVDHFTTIEQLTQKVLSNPSYQAKRRWMLQPHTYSSEGTMLKLVEADGTSSYSNDQIIMSIELSRMVESVWKTAPAWAGANPKYTRFVGQTSLVTLLKRMNVDIRQQVAAATVEHKAKADAQKHAYLLAQVKEAALVLCNRMINAGMVIPENISQLAGQGVNNE